MCPFPLMSKGERSHVKNLDRQRVQMCKEKGGKSCLDGCCSFSHHMLPSMTKGEIVASTCLIDVVINVNISLLSLVSTISCSITCLEDLYVEDIEKISLSGRNK